jgi:hypothetical protein
MAKGQSGRRQIVPECHEALDRMKYEIAAELGLPVGYISNGSADTEFAAELGSTAPARSREAYWGHIASRDAGAVGGTITKRLVQLAEESMRSF